MTMCPLSRADFPEDLALFATPAVPLCKLTTLKIGGPASMICRLTTPAIAQQFQSVAKEINYPYYVWGAGSNILAPDEGYGGLIFKVETHELSVRGARITVGAGLPFADLISGSLDAGLVGLEFASGIPGTVGGAVMGNAGCYGHEICDFLHEAVVLTPEGELETLGPEDFAFGYRTTSLRESGAILLSATFKLASGDVPAARHTGQEHLQDRLAKHPVDIPCAGSWFRNLPPATPGDRRQAAGRLLEIVGAKAMHQGDARVFAKHANMIINTGQASCRDVSLLAARMQAAVQQEFGVQLVEEVRRLVNPAG